MLVVTGGRTGALKLIKTFTDRSQFTAIKLLLERVFGGGSAVKSQLLEKACHRHGTDVSALSDGATGIHQQGRRIGQQVGCNPSFQLW